MIRPVTSTQSKFQSQNFSSHSFSSWKNRKLHGLSLRYKTSNRLSAKSDVYSFGITLLEIVSCRPAISKSQGKDSVHIVKWVGSRLAQGDTQSIADPRLKGEYNITSVQKAVEIAMACVAVNSIRRPTMGQVVAELKVCLATELDRTPESRPPNSTDYTDMTSIYRVLPAQSGPMARWSLDRILVTSSSLCFSRFLCIFCGEWLKTWHVHISRP